MVIVIFIAAFWSDGTGPDAFRYPHCPCMYAAYAFIWPIAVHFPLQCNSRMRTHEYEKLRASRARWKMHRTIKILEYTLSWNMNVLQAKWKRRNGCTHLAYICCSEKRVKFEYSVHDIGGLWFRHRKMRIGKKRIRKKLLCNALFLIASFLPTATLNTSVSRNQMTAILFRLIL